MEVATMEVAKPVTTATTCSSPTTIDKSTSSTPLQHANYGSSINDSHTSSKKRSNTQMNSVNPYADQQQLCKKYQEEFERKKNLNDRNSFLLTQVIFETITPVGYEQSILDMESAPAGGVSKNIYLLFHRLFDLTTSVACGRLNSILGLNKKEPLPCKTVHHFKCIFMRVIAHEYDGSKDMIRHLVKCILADLQELKCDGAMIPGSSPDHNGKLYNWWFFL